MVWRVIETDRYTLNILEGAGWDEVDDNIDVEVILPSNQRYGATLFTVQNLQRLINGYKKSGENKFGKYVWASDMIVLERLTVQHMIDTIDDLIDTECFHSAFVELIDDDD